MVQHFANPKRVGEKMLFYTGPAFVVFAGVLICGVIYVHFVNSIPFYSPLRSFSYPSRLTTYSSVSSLLHLLSSVFISFCILYNYIMAVVSKPGYPPSAEELGWTPEQVEALKEGHYHNIHFDFKWCKKCLFHSSSHSLI